MNYRSVNDLTRLVLNNLHKIPHDIDLVVGVPRSGMLVASYIALLMNKPLSDLDGLLNNHLMNTGHTKNTDELIKKISECKKILVVEDSVSSGKSILECKRKVNASSLKCEVIYLAAYVLPSSIEMVDLYLEVLSDLRIFEWNIFHQPKMLNNACFDLDGVLCVDPNPEQNDDGEKYVEFIKNAKVKILPKGEIGYIVTSRLEKYREETEQWLLANHINYKKLIMLDSTAKERAEKGLHASYKSDFYAKCDAILFVESESRQAYEINQKTQKPVLCIEDNSFYDGNKRYIAKYESSYKIRSFFRQFKFIRFLYYKMKRGNR